MYSTSKTANTATKRSKAEKVASDEIVYDLKLVGLLVDSHLATVIEMCEKAMLKRKDTIRAATLHAIRDQLVANSK